MQNGISPVYAASHEGQTEVVDLLVQAGADIHLATTKVHVSTHTVSSSVAAVVETNVRLIEFVVYDLQCMGSGGYSSWCYVCCLSVSQHLTSQMSN